MVRQSHPRFSLPQALALQHARGAVDRRTYLAGLCAALAGCNARSLEGKQPATTTQPAYQTCPGPYGSCQYARTEIGNEALVDGSVTLELAIENDCENFATMFTTRNDLDRLNRSAISANPGLDLVDETDFSSAVILIIQDGTSSASQPFPLERVTAPETSTLHATAQKSEINIGDGESVVPTIIARVPVADHSPSHLTVDIEAPYEPGEDFVVVDSFSMAETDPAYSSATNSTK